MQDTKPVAADYPRILFQSPPGASEPAVQVLRTVEELRSVQVEWEAFLRDRAEEHDLRQHPLYIIKRIQHANARISPFVVILRRRGIECVAPFYIMRRRIDARFGPLAFPAPTVTVLRTFGERFVHSRGSAKSEDVAHLLRGLVPFVHEFDGIWMPEIDVPGEIWKVFDSGKRARVDFKLIVLHPHTETVQLIRLPANFDDYMASFKSKVRRKRKADLRKLERSCGDLTLTVATRPEEMREFLFHADEIRNRSWHARAYGADRWKDEKRIRFHEEIAESGWVRGYLLRCKGRAIAFHLGYLEGDAFIAEEMAYLDEVRDLGAGAGLMLLMLENLCIETGGVRVILQPTDNTLKRSLGNETYDVGRAVLVPRKSIRRRFLFGTERFFAFQQERVARLIKRARALRAGGRKGRP